MRVAKARRARTTRIVADPASSLPLTGDGKIYDDRARYTLDGVELGVSYLTPPLKTDPKGTTWSACVTQAGRPSRAVSVATLYPI